MSESEYCFEAHKTKKGNLTRLVFDERGAAIRCFDLIKTLINRANGPLKVYGLDDGEEFSFSRDRIFFENLTERAIEPGPQLLDRVDNYAFLFEREPDTFRIEIDLETLPKAKMLAIQEELKKLTQTIYHAGSYEIPYQDGKKFITAVTIRGVLHKAKSTFDQMKAILQN